MNRVITIGILAVVIGALYFIVLRLPKTVSTPPTETEQIMCTMDALQCPDGSYVGRTGPKCEFVCPN